MPAVAREPGATAPGPGAAAPETAAAQRPGPVPAPDAAQGPGPVPAPDAAPGVSDAHALGAARTLWELLVRRAELTPQAPVLIQAADDPAEDRTATFGLLRSRVERTAAGLYEKGVRPGQTVAWQLPTRIETVVLSLALARLGVRQTPLIPVYGEREVALALRATDSAWYVHPGTWRGRDYASLADRISTRLGLTPRTLTAYDTLPDG
ncbi:AMP-binding protein, partial [Streptomyces sp. PU-14G]|uniref:AMP-binding protein n=1 Tax=Streptomyces sp. PU-14G TaxID=2800808 RepID=UPI0034DE7A68